MTAKRLSVLGGTGLLGKAFLKYTPAKYQVKSIDRESIGDFQNFDNIRVALNVETPDVLVNCAAITNLKKCEKDFNTIEVNGCLPIKLAYYCMLKNIKYVHISTDHFYHGDGSKPHSETDKITLLNGYATQKYFAEQGALANPDALIIRTSILGIRGTGNETLFEWILGSAVLDKDIDGFTNAYTSALDTKSVVDCIIRMIESDSKGIYNVACNETYSKFDLAREIYNRVSSSGKVNPCLLKNDDTTRGDSLGLSSQKLKSDLGISAPSFETVIENLMEMRSE